jgi:hypothetical protein
VVDTARREDELARAGDDHVIAELEGQLALEHVERLVEVVVVQRRPRPPGRERVEDQRRVAAALLAAHQDLGREGGGAHRAAPAATGRAPPGRDAPFGASSPSGFSLSPSTTSSARRAIGAATTNTVCTASMTSVRAAA